MSYIAVIVILAAVVCLIVGIYLIAPSRRTVAGPRCGHCNYNLTGSTANRCPECGRLFIEAGVVTNPVASLRKRRLIGIVLIVAPLIPVTLGFATTMFYRARAARQAAAIEKAKAAAILNFLSQDILQSTSAPASRSKPCVARNRMSRNGSQGRGEGPGASGTRAICLSRPHREETHRSRSGLVRRARGLRATSAINRSRADDPPHSMATGTGIPEMARCRTRRYCRPHWRRRRSNCTGFRHRIAVRARVRCRRR